VVGNNDDWFCNVAYFVVSPRGITKQTFLPSAGKRLEWTSKYGSVTMNFNFVGSPSGGMNEAGLVIDESWPGPCRYPDPDDRPVLDEIQWLQYQFDNCATVDEVIQTDPKLRIVGFFGKSHYFVCDKNGKAATIEWIDGKMVAHILTNDILPVLTNDNYDWSISQLKKYKGFGGEMPVGNTTSSLDRFCRAANMVKQFASNKNIIATDYGFTILENISQQSTEFSWVYDITNRTICYKTAWSKEIKKVPLRNFDFISKDPLLMTDILTSESGDITGNFEPYTLEKNRDFVTRVVKSWRANGFAKHITDADVEKMIWYPETMKYSK
jgi:choloylglycine hydrolase